MSFQDHFSRQSNIYLKARPTYPDELFAFLASLVKSHDVCWDCATGNGQAAISLAPYFKKIIATDPSKKQIDNAIQRDNIEYRIASAEESGLADHSINMITVATGAHWFDLDKFYAEAKRVAMPNGVLALWTYSSAFIDPLFDELMEWFAYDFLYAYWPDGRWYVRNQYKTLPFPFEALSTPQFYCKMQWNKAQWLDYLRSWSSYNNYVAQHQKDPIELLLPKLNAIWNDTEIKTVQWPLHLKCAVLNKVA